MTEPHQNRPGESGTEAFPAVRSRQAGRRSRGWVIFFVGLATLVAIAITLPILYNRGQQLRPEQLARARELWRQAGPADYDLTFSVQYDRDPLPIRHVVLVRGGQVVWASCEGELVVLSPALQALIGLPLAGLPRAQDAAGGDVPAIFDRLEALLEDEEGHARGQFLIAVFDPQTGYPRRFIRRIRRTSTREEWNLRVWPPGKLPRPGRGGG